MSRYLRILAAFVALNVAGVPAAAQHGEVQLGLAASYGTPTAFGAGVGPVAGIVLGRLAYFGGRWLAYSGGNEQLGPGEPTDLKSSAHVYLTDLGVVIPAGPFEALPAISLGAARYTQGGVEHAVEFVVAPGLSLHAYLAGLVLIPEVQYLITGRPQDLTWPTDRHGAFASLRVMIPIEVGRVRY